MLNPQPDLNVREGAVPADNLNDKRKGKAGDMEYFYKPVSHPEEYAKYQEYYPEEMDKDD